jgi:hypothetical protein
VALREQAIFRFRVRSQIRPEILFEITKYNAVARIKSVGIVLFTFIFRKISDRKTGLSGAFLSASIRKQSGFNNLRRGGLVLKKA